MFKHLNPRLPEFLSPLCLPRRPSYLTSMAPPPSQLLLAVMLLPEPKPYCRRRLGNRCGFPVIDPMSHCVTSSGRWSTPKVHTYVHQHLVCGIDPIGSIRNYSEQMLQVPVTSLNLVS